MYYCKSNASFDVCKSVKPYITRSLKKDVVVCIIYVHPTIYFFNTYHLISHLILYLELFFQQYIPAFSLIEMSVNMTDR